MLTTTFAPKISTRNVCVFCHEPANDAQGLVREQGGYIHAACSNRPYQLVKVVSFPATDIDPEPDPTTPASAAAATGPELCSDCIGLHDPEDICPACQKLINEWESDHYIEPDWNTLYERFQAAKDYGIIAIAA